MSANPEHLLFRQGKQVLSFQKDLSLDQPALRFGENPQNRLRDGRLTRTRLSNKRQRMPRLREKETSFTA